MRPGQVSDLSGEEITTGIKKLRVKIHGLISNELKTVYLDETFSVGRSKVNDIVLPDNAISRKHLEIRKHNSNWVLHDLESANGTFLDDRPVGQDGKTLIFPCTIRFGFSEIYLEIDLHSETPVVENKPLDEATQILPINSELTHSPSTDSSYEKLTTTSLNTQHKPITPDEIQQKFFDRNGDVNAGEYTQLVRRAINEHKQKKTRKYKIGIGIISLFLLITVGIVFYQQLIISNAKALAIDMFYDMKEMEVSLGKVEYQLQNEIENIQQEKVKNILLAAAKEKREKLHEMKKKYQAYLAKVEATKVKRITTFLKSNNYEEKLILKVARKFGESELEVPKGFSSEVLKYIRYWQRTQRMNRAMRRLERKQYRPIIINALKKQNLPPQFLYLVLQESNFVNQAVGPETRHGIAKGAWQFLPTTGAEFGLKPGPLAQVTEYDPRDERFNFKKASIAGAKYLKHIYSTEAQASGLLVLASYNYGHNRVKAKIRKMPKNPRERNFWKFIQKYEIPQETYDYVFYIFAAAVIGENPSYFGFKFRSPTTIQ